jgi:hypothetical protein
LHLRRSPTPGAPLANDPPPVALAAGGAWHVSAPTWDLPHLQKHLQYAVALELWTIPFYMSALYSIRDRSSEAAQLLQSVVYQEMLHLQLASNVSNAFGHSPSFEPPIYQGTTIPHLDFKLDEKDPTPEYSPYSAEIGPLDPLRINAMCLVEYPEWDTGTKPELKEDMKEYGSIGHLYQAIEFGVTELREDIRGRNLQVDLFRQFYQNHARLTVTRNGAAGLPEVIELLQIVRTQGEAAKKLDSIPLRFENTADDPAPSLSHFSKFSKVRGARLPETYTGVVDPPVGSPAHEAQEEVRRSFRELLGVLERLFSGKDASDMGSTMARVGAAIGNCWKRGAVPRFS